MDLEGIVLSEKSQMEKDMYDRCYLWNLKNTTTKTPPTHRKRDHVCGHQRQGWEAGG